MLTLANHSWVNRCLPNHNALDGDVCVAFLGFSDVTGSMDSDDEYESMEEDVKNQLAQDMYDSILSETINDISSSITDIQLIKPQHDKWMMVKNTDFPVVLESIDPIYYVPSDIPWNTEGEPVKLIIMLKEDEGFSNSFVVSAALVQCSLSSDGEFVVVDDIPQEKLHDIKSALKPFFNM